MREYPKTFCLAGTKTGNRHLKQDLDRVRAGPGVQNRKIANLEEGNGLPAKQKIQRLHADTTRTLGVTNDG